MLNITTMYGRRSPGKVPLTSHGGYYEPPEHQQGICRSELLKKSLNHATMCADIQDRTAHELCAYVFWDEKHHAMTSYIWLFVEAVGPNVTSVLCSYYKLNTSWSCENEALLTGLLKDELDF